VVSDFSVFHSWSGIPPENHSSTSFRPILKGLGWVYPRGITGMDFWVRDKRTISAHRHLTNYLKTYRMSFQAHSGKNKPEIVPMFYDKLYTRSIFPFFRTVHTYNYRLGHFFYSLCNGSLYVPTFM
jgi:hypothetical protein